MSIAEYTNRFPFHLWLHQPHPRGVPSKGPRPFLSSPSAFSLFFFDPPSASETALWPPTKIPFAPHRTLPVPSERCFLCSPQRIDSAFSQAVNQIASRLGALFSPFLLPAFFWGRFPLFSSFPVQTGFCVPERGYGLETLFFPFSPPGQILHLLLSN